jgi:hypothetical protein
MKYHLKWYKGQPKPWRIYDENGLPTGHDYDEDDPLDEAYDLMGDDFDGQVVGMVVAKPGQFANKVREMMEDQP